MLKGVYDFSLVLKAKAGKADDLFFKDGQLGMRYTEIAGGVCGSSATACDT